MFVCLLLGGLNHIWDYLERIAPSRNPVFNKYLCTPNIYLIITTFLLTPRGNVHKINNIVYVIIMELNLKRDLLHTVYYLEKHYSVYPTLSMIDCNHPSVALEL